MPPKKEAPLTFQLHIRCQPELRDILSRLAGPELPLNDFIVRLLAEKVDRPDLAKVPRKRIGRPRKEYANA